MSSHLRVFIKHKFFTGRGGESEFFDNLNKNNAWKSGIYLLIGNFKCNRFDMFVIAVKEDSLELYIAMRFLEIGLPLVMVEF